MAYTFKLSGLNGNNGFRIDGIAPDDLTGLSVSGAGDVNGDGFDDFLIGSHTSDFNADLSGAAFLVYGKDGAFPSRIDLASLNGTTGVRFEGELAVDIAGFSVSGAGDINGDGRDDFLISSFLADKTGFNSGSTYVIYGNGAASPPVVELASIAGTAGFRIDGAEAFGYAGISVIQAGDVNGDGIDDIMIGASGLRNAYGQTVGGAYVVFGNDQGFGDTLNLGTLNGNNGFKIANTASSAAIGLVVGGNGDFNGDGFDDVIVSCYGATSGGERAFVVYGKASGLPSSINVADLNGSNGFTITGAAGQGLGKAIASAGDFNGDGIDDIAVTAILYNDAAQQGTEGAAYVILGDSGGFGTSFDVSALDGSNGFRLIGRPGELIGASVASAGDVNGDGFDDLLIGANYLASSGTKTGGAYLVFGKSGGFDAQIDLGQLAWNEGFRIDGVAAGDQTGLGVKSAGDLNGDGYDDLIIGAYTADPGGHSNAGSGYVIFGSGDIVLAPGLQLSEMTVDQGFRVLGAQALDVAGYSLSSAGDVNGDGRDDFIVGAPGGVFPDGGDAYVVFGRNGDFPRNFNLSSINGSNGFRVTGGAAGAGLGTAVSSAGDVNGDGLADIAVNADFAASGVGDTGGDNRGATYIIFGKTGSFTTSLNVASLDGSNGFRITGTSNDDLAGSAIAAGDINGDGISDLVLGAPGRDSGGNFSGSTYVVFGKASGFAANLNLSNLNGSNGFRIDGAAKNDYSGFDVGSGDLNGDGIDDVVIGAPTAHVGTSSPGAVYVVFGKTTAASPTLSLGALNGTNGYRFTGVAGSDGAGNSAASAGDINGDGIDDLIIGAVTGKAGAIRPGTAYVVFGGSANFRALDGADGSIDGSIALSKLTAARGFTITGERDSDFLGCSVRGAGDINGDGFADLIVGAYSASPNGFHEGSAYVVFGKASGFGGNINVLNLDGRNGFRIDGAEQNNQTGFAVSAAGDVNSDGFDDLMVSAIGPLGTAGVTYVVYGHEPDFAVSRTGTAAGQTILGGTKSDTLNGLAGNDILDGRGSSDTAVFAANVAHVINLKLTAAQDTGEGSDRLISIENLIAGNKADTLTGNADANRLEGRGGNDILRGDAGNDVLLGGSGQDSLAGGGGKDIFDFDSLGDSGTTITNRDTILDFTLDPATGSAFTDRLDVSGIDARPTTSGDDAFKFIKQADFSGAGQIRATQSGSDTLVEINTAGSSGTEMSILLKNVTASLLSMADFIL